MPWGHCYVAGRTASRPQCSFSLQGRCHLTLCSGLPYGQPAEQDSGSPTVLHLTRALSFMHQAATRYSFSSIRVPTTARCLTGHSFRLPRSPSLFYTPPLHPIYERCLHRSSRRAGRPAMALYLPPLDRCPHDGCNRRKLREGVAVGVKFHSISGVVHARSLSRTCRQCGNHFTLGLTTYRTGFYKDVVVPVTLSALPTATEELDSSVGVRAHTITDNLLRVSNHHVVETSLAHLWYLHASQGRSSTETQATVHTSMGARETLLVESDAFIGDEDDGALNQLMGLYCVLRGAAV